jgi:hypothetical protein
MSLMLLFVRKGEKSHNDSIAIENSLFLMSQHLTLELSDEVYGSVLNLWNESK